MKLKRFSLKMDKRVVYWLDRMFKDAMIGLICLAVFFILGIFMFG
jgi:hypothetical protein